MQLLRIRTLWKTIVSAAGLLAVLGFAPQAPARAQNEPVPKEVGALFDDISDIDKLRVLNPLKLTPDQIDRLIAAIKKAQAEYNQKLADAAVPPIKQIAEEIKETRRKLLTSGGDVPKDFDAKVKKVQEEFIQRRDAQDAATLQSLSDAVRAILTPEQVSTAVSLARKQTEKDGKATLKGDDSKFFNFYVLGVFIVYPRTVPLLEDMKKAARDNSGAALSHRAARRYAARTSGRVREARR